MIFFVHGFTGHPGDWHEVTAGLPAEVAWAAPPLYGHRGHGEPGDEVDGFEDEVDRLARLVPAGAPVHLLGYSLGGRLALGLLVRHPQLFARATLIGAQPGLRSEAERAERLRADAAWVDLLERGDVERFAEAWEAQPLFASQRELPDEVRAPSRGRRRRHAALGLAKALKALGLGRMPDLWPQLPEIRQPLALVHGARDEKFAALAAQTARAVAGARLISIPGAGHNPLLERPRLIAQLLHT